MSEDDEPNDYVKQKEIVKYLQDNERVQYVSYDELLRVYGCEVNYFNIPKVNKKLIYLHFQFYNKAYEQMWYYKWTPILSLALFRLFRLRRVTLILPIIYIYAFDSLFYQYFLASNYHTRNINLAQSFTYSLIKPQCIHTHLYTFIYTLIYIYIYLQTKKLDTPISRSFCRQYNIT